MASLRKMTFPVKSPSMFLGMCFATGLLAGDAVQNSSADATEGQRLLSVAAAALPIFTAEPKDVCAGVAYYDGNGVMRTGTLPCDPGGAQRVPAPCAMDGQLDCLTTEAFKAADTHAFLPSDVKLGQRFAGVTGALPPCTSDGGTNCFTTVSFKAADMAQATAGHIKTGVTIAGVAGSGQAVPACTTDGQADCATSADFPAADATRLVPANIVSGTTIAGVTGTKRGMMLCRNSRGIANINGSRSSPYDGTLLTGGSVDIVQGSTAVTGNTTNFGLIGLGDLITVNGETRRVASLISTTSLTVDVAFTQASASAQAYAITHSANADLTVDDRQGNGVAGSASGTITVTAGQTTVAGVGTAFTSELAIGDYITVNGEERTVVAIGGDTSLTVNAAFSASAANAAYATVNFYTPGSNCDVRNFADVSGNAGLVPDAGKNAAWKAIFQDKLTGLYLTNVLSTTATWTMAVDACAALNGGTAGSGWRLPTQKELMQLHIDGISHLGGSDQSAFGKTNTSFWASTISSGAPSQEYTVNLAGGFVSSSLTSNKWSYACIR